MKSIQLTSIVTSSYEEVLELVDGPKPALRPGHALVKVYCAAVNPVDSIISRGHGKGFGWPMPEPFTPGVDFSGVVESVGDGVTNVSVGDAVFGNQWSQGRPHELEDAPLVCGSFAEYILIAASKLTLKPPELSYEVAAAIPTVCGTAYECLISIGKISAGSKVLIFGGSSAVGFCGVQIAKLKGAYVVTTCSSRTKDFVQTFNPDKIIDYTETDWSTDEELKNFDVIFDAVGEKDGLSRAVASGTVKPDGVFVSVANFTIGWDPAGHPPLSFGSAICMKQDPAENLDCAKWIVEGNFKLPVEETFPFTREGVLAAMKKIETGKSQGKNVICVHVDQ